MKRRRSLNGVVRCGALLLALFATSSAWTQKPLQVIVSVKIIEFQTTKGVETGLSAYFTKVSRAKPFGQVSTSGSSINTADLTFPTSAAAGISVFLDRISLNEGEIEILLQALVNENRAFILSRPHAIVMVGEPTATIVQTTQEIPYESTVVVGNTAVQVTKFESTGVTLHITVPDIIDDDGDWNTRNDTYVQLDVKASVQEEGQRIVIALDDQLAGGGDDDIPGRNLITVPEFISRSIATHVWVRDGQVLMLGGLYRNTESRNISTLPWLTQAEDVAVGFVEKVVSGSLSASPLSATVGSRDTLEGRRELVFLIKAEAWRPAFTIVDMLGFEERLDAAPRRPPADLIRTVPDQPQDASPDSRDADTPTGDGG
ncbi:MAG: hypothetical protein QGD90_07550 [Candidatus Hydrogenedentes bacterium]|nr:hypothetical protein [Candidatus Hydrogenedentota bacterium]